nr:MAG TPA: CRM1 / Exportin repeat 3 [Caudoviricetes sp.]
MVVVQRLSAKRRRGCWAIGAQGLRRFLRY